MSFAKRMPPVYLGCLGMLIGTAALVLRGAAQTTNEPGNILAITGGTLLDGTGAAPRPNVTILVKAGRIARIGPAGSIPIPADATVIPAGGKFLLPGLIDAHVHYRDYYPELLITHGITSVVDWGGSPVEWILAQKEGIHKGKIYGPRIYTSGDVIGETRSKDGAADEAVLRVRELAALGVDRIDVGLEISSAALRAVIAESHRLGLLVSGYPLRARDAIESGLDAIKHAHTLGRASQTDPAVLESLARQTDLPERSRNSYPCLLVDHYDDLLQLMLARKTVWIPTLVKDFKSVTDRRDEFEKENFALLSNPELQYLPVQDLLPQITNSSDEGLRTTPCGIIGTYDRSSPDYVLYQRTYQNLKDFIRKMVQSGGRVLAGTAPHSAVLPGISLHQEMLLFVDAGLTPLQALQSASLWVAEYVGAQKDIGSVAEGKFADLLILGKNPLEDIRNARSIETVIQGGRVLPTGYHRAYANPIPRNTLRTAPSGGYPRPELREIAPLVTVESSGDLPVKLRGRQFNPKSFVVFEKTPLQTEFVSETELRAVIPATLLRTAGTYWLHVFSPRPGGGDSSPVSLIVKFR